MSRSNSARAGHVGIQEQSQYNLSLTEKYRRNGKLQSCEPCRKSKLRCDHVVPACGRCIKRGRTDSCFYHPNPLTQKVCLSGSQIIELKLLKFQTNSARILTCFPASPDLSKFASNPGFVDLADQPTSTSRVNRNATRSRGELTRLFSCSHER